MASRTSVTRAVGQVLLGSFLGAAGILHLTSARREFQAQVPSWFPGDPDLVVVVSGVVEIGLGAALLATWKQPNRARLGLLVAAFFVAVFPGNVNQWVQGVDGFGLDTDAKRLARLPFQVPLVAGAIAATGAWPLLKQLLARRHDG